MSTKIAKPLTLAIGTLVGSMSLVQMAQANTTFQLNQLTAGYMTTGFGEGKCGEGKCGVPQMDSNKDGKASKAEFDAMGAKMFTEMDADKDGSLTQAEIDAHKAAHHKGKEGSCGSDKGKEGSCGADKKGKEGSCGADKKGKEGSCGEKK